MNNGKSKKIAYLGPENSFSCLAVKKYISGLEQNYAPLLCSIFFDVLDNVKIGAADLAIVPLENSTEGIVNEVTDGLIFSDTDLYINADFSIAIDNFLIYKNGSKLENINTLYSHWQPFGQCRNTIKKLLPNAKVVFENSTASAVAAIKDNASAAIGGKQLVSGNFIASDKPINDATDNRTRFAIISKYNSFCPTHTKSTITFETQNKSGALVEILSILKKHNLNMTRLESRPHKSHLGRYIFLVDIAANAHDKKTATALSLIEKKSSFYKFLGSYRTIDLD